MTDIFCRICGEPYGCTGGLHYSHSDMTWFEFDQFVEGKGCPCCLGEQEGFAGNQLAISRDRQDERTMKWARSVQSASDETEPVEGWFSDILKRPWKTGQWEADPPSLRKVVESEINVLSNHISEVTDDDGVEELWAVMTSENFSDNERDAIRFSNFRHVVESLRPKGTWEYDHEFRVLLAKRDTTGEVFVFPDIVEIVRDCERAVADYPVLDEDKYNEIDAELAEEALTQAFDEVARELCTLLGWTDEQSQAWMKIHQEKLFERQDVNESGYNVPQYVMKKDLDDILALACAGVPLIGYQVHSSMLSERTWLVRSVLEPDTRLISGLLVKKELIGTSDHFVHLDRVRDVPAHEFGGFVGRDFIPTVNFMQMPLSVRLAIIRWLRDPEEETNLRNATEA